MIKGLPEKEYHKRYYQDNKEIMKQVRLSIADDKRIEHREAHRKLKTLIKTQKARIYEKHL